MLATGRVWLMCRDCKTFWKVSASVFKKDPMKLRCPDCDSSDLFGVIPK